MHALCMCALDSTCMETLMNRRKKIYKNAVNCNENVVMVVLQLQHKRIEVNILFYGQHENMHKIARDCTYIGICNNFFLCLFIFGMKSTQDEKKSAQQLESLPLTFRAHKFESRLVFKETCFHFICSLARSLSLSLCFILNASLLNIELRTHNHTRMPKHIYSSKLETISEYRIANVYIAEIYIDIVI